MKDVEFSKEDLSIIEAMKELCRNKPWVYKSLSPFERVILGEMGFPPQRNASEAKPKPR